MLGRGGRSFEILQLAMQTPTVTLVFALACLRSASQAAENTADATAVSFRRDIAPIVVRKCVTCHGPEKTKGGYRLDTFERLMKGGESKSPAVVAGKPEE